MHKSEISLFCYDQMVMIQKTKYFFNPDLFVKTVKGWKSFLINLIRLQLLISWQSENVD